MNSRQAVTGLVVNEKVNTRIEYKRAVRAMAHNLFTTGKFNRVPAVLGSAGVTLDAAVEGTVNQLNGMLAFIDAVNLYNLRKIEDSSAKHAGGPRIERQLNGSEKTYRDFIFFKHFYFNDFPIIICEGKTDNVYLKFAIKALASEFTNLGEKSVEGEINLKL
ncbi:MULTISPECIES: hypothetical protein [unclassified Caballeronia]|uniref:hypothetical protein n=1 Tax=unclassified Caballeronia TaxID=2646786 RepID=UPI0013ED11DA|nr:MULTISPECIES: hypothetical protein [unclassified Caballeronia]